MRHKPLLISIIFGLMIASCEKQNYTQGIPRQQTFVKDAIQYLDSQVGDEELAKLSISSPNLIQYQGKPVAVRVYTKTDPSPDRFVILYKKEGRFTGYWVDKTGLHKELPDTYKGTMSLLDLTGSLRIRYTVEENKVTGIYDAVEGKAIQLNTPSLSPPDNPYELEAVVVTPQHRENKDYYNLFWFLNREDEFRECFITDDEYMRNGGGESSSEMAVAVEFPEPDYPIKDIKDELKCFTIDPKATYSVTVNVNQPVPGSRELVNLNANHNAGHAFLTLSEQTDGNSIIRNVGFYPLHSAKSVNGNDQSIFGDDSKTSSSVSLKLSVSATEFNNLQTVIYDLVKYNYDLNDNNCTTVIIDALNKINIHLPSTIGDNLLFKGNDPADLGEDLRLLNLNLFSNQNGGRHVVRNVSNKNSLYPPNKTGTCK
ncbi:MAG: hypothetical protein INR73_03650 [Williamsia sp.]|nr:hypothetical protein [Williamsia sp.]